MNPSDTPETVVSGRPFGDDLLDVVHSMCRTLEEGLVEVRSDLGNGRIAFRSGRILHAQIADLQGEEAFLKMVCATGGDFRLLPLDPEEIVSIVKPWEDLLVEAIRVQESSRQQEAPKESQAQKTESLFQMVHRMKLTEKLRFALRCDKEGRTLLIRDPNRAIQLAIIANPRITDGEVAVIAWSRGSDEEVLRRIADSREWVRYYPVRLGLTMNPKTPISISTKLLSTLMPEDVSRIARSKDVPALIAHAARRQILQKG